MTSQPATYQTFPDIDRNVEPEGDFDVMNPVRGIVMGIALCAPFWVGVYLFFSAR
jgi:hypothetical protein